MPVNEVTYSSQNGASAGVSSMNQRRWNHFSNVHKWLDRRFAQIVLAQFNNIDGLEPIGNDSTAKLARPV
jgi:hypothetical protein